MKTHHTPGPWYQVGSWVEVEDDAIADICSCDPETIGQGKLGRSYGEIKANAMLISAAPELLESLQQCVDLMSNGGTWTLEMQSAARSAIAKATGE